MLKKLKSLIIIPLQLIIRDSRTIGVLLSLCAIFSLILSNSTVGSFYSDFWEYPIFAFKEIHVPLTVKDWINDALMAVFFFVAGLEIKKELKSGTLKTPQNAILPVFAALGGMVVPALIYIFINGANDYATGWGIPMATDIAFSLGIASLLGKRIPVSLKIFLMALAIIDDLGAIVVIAIFYATTIHWVYIIVAALLVLLLRLSRYWLSTRFLLHVFAGIALWVILYNSGIHATISGVLLAFTIPTKSISNLTEKLHFPVQFIILPLFALANTVIYFPKNILVAFQEPYSIGIILGLLIGKPMGIVTFSWVLVKLKWGKLPNGVDWLQMIGIGILAGIGFTMSIFITTLAFGEDKIQNLAKIAILFASLFSGIVGFIILSRFKAKVKAKV
jgi:NhaA family Na+:H+ antiporter